MMHMTGTRNLLRAHLTQARQVFALPDAWCWRKDAALLMDSSFAYRNCPLGWGRKSPNYSISSFTSFIPTNPGARAGPGISSLFPPLNHNGSPELGVPLPSCIGDLAGANKKKKKNLDMGDYKTIPLLFSA